jgi:hypothetical protein
VGEDDQVSLVCGLRRGVGLREKKKREKDFSI